MMRRWKPGWLFASLLVAATWSGCAVQDSDLDGEPDADDCAENDVDIHHGVIEQCDGIDNNCDGAEDEGFDMDGDTYVDCGTATASDDCDDEDPAAYPGAIESCNYIDDNCDGLMDDADPDIQGQSTWYRDQDGDGYGAVASGTATTCSNPSGYSAVSTDCDDTSTAIHPAATEVVGDGIDQNCDGNEICFVDADDDGYPVTSPGTQPSVDIDCDDANEGTNADLQTDCDDTSTVIHPAATEVVGDGIDQNCDGNEVCFLDADDDGYLVTSPGTQPSIDIDCDDANEGTNADLQTDCDDTSAAVHPEATEVVGDGIDQNCDGNELCFVDADDDGYPVTSPGTQPSVDIDCDDANEGTNADLQTDCDDTSTAVHPAATEVIGDGIDQNCDGNEVCFVDADGDGYLVTSPGTQPSVDTDCDDGNEGTNSDLQTDCDDTSTAVHPAATEVVGDGIDQNCDGNEVCFLDADDDGYLVTSPGTQPSVDTDCDDANEGASADLQTDCDDGLATVHPNANESCNGIDDDCTGGTDEELPRKRYYVDADEDGFGTDSLDRVVGCTPSVWPRPNTLRYSSLRGDCDDSEAAIYPGAPDPDDDTDQDCGGSYEREPNQQHPDKPQLNQQPSVGLESSTYTSIREAVKAASIQAQATGIPVTVWVGPGTFTEDSIEIVSYSVSVRSVAGAENTVIVPDGANSTACETNVVNGQNVCTGINGSAFIVESVRCDYPVTLEGFTLNGFSGSCYNNGKNLCNRYGGAVMVMGASIEMRDLVIENSWAKYGGGAYVFEGTGGDYSKCTVEMDHVVFSSNTAAIDGGGLCLSDVGVDRGELPVLANLQFIANDTLEGGGGGLATINSTFSLTHALFRDNCVPKNVGGAGYLISGSPQITNVLVLNNYARNSGGGFYTANAPISIVHSVFLGNSIDDTIDPPGLGDGVSIDVNSGTFPSDIRGNVFASNGTCNLYINVPLPDISWLTYSDLYLENTESSGLCLSDGTLGQAPISVEPLFLSNTDFHLSLESSLIDITATPEPDSEWTNWTDCDGSAPDLGAYGGPGGCHWDLDGDGVYGYYWPGLYADGDMSSDWDCDDGDPDVWPGAQEVANDGLDNGCYGNPE